VREAAAACGVPQRTIRSWLARAKIESLPSNRGRMVRLADVRELARQVAVNGKVGKRVAEVAEVAEMTQNGKVAEMTHAATALPSIAEEDLARLADLLADRLRPALVEALAREALPPPEETGGGTAPRAPWWRRVFG
jgi:hypothetical protein